jgi:hypothetical protein
MLRLLRFLRKPVFIIGFLVVIVPGAIISYHYLWLFDPILAPIYDLYTGQQRITEVKDAGKVLASFPVLAYQDISELDFADRLGISGQKYKALYQKQKFLTVSWFSRYRYVAGDIRMKDFLPKDRLIGNRIPIPAQEKIHYLPLSSRLVEKIILLQTEMEKAGLDEKAFAVTSGFRPPAYNDLVKGKPKSRHLHGDAIDIIVFDTNQDGEINRQDEEAVFQILENKVIRNQGGLGTYKSTQNLIHFDTRGYRARWRY